MSESTTVALTIHVTAPNAGDAQHHAQTIADLVQAEFGDSMRLRIEQHPDAPVRIAATTDQPPDRP